MKRYDFFDIHFLRDYEAADGEFVLYEDVKKLEDQIEFLKVQLKCVNEMAAESGYTAIQGIATRAIVLTADRKL